MENLREIKAVSWDDVFSLWRDNEAEMPHWIKHYQEAGYKTWDEWRSHSFRDLPLDKLDWKLYEIQNPEQTVMEFFGGPFRAWIKNHYNGKTTVRFRDLANDAGIAESITTNQIIENFPDNSTLVGLRTNEGIVIIEGMHRCCALAVSGYRNQPINKKIQIAIADFMDHPIPISGKETSPTV